MDVKSNEQQEMDAFKKFQLLLYSLIWLVGTIACLLVICVIVCSKLKLKSATNVFLLNLAFADFVYLQGIPLFLSNIVNRQWLFSVLTCKVFWFITGVNQFTSVFILTLLAFDRYLAVCRQDLSSWRKLTSSRFILAGIWLLSITCLLPVIIFSNIDTPTVDIYSPHSPSIHHDQSLTHHYHHHNENQTQSISDRHLSLSSLRIKTTTTMARQFPIRVCTILWPENNLFNLDVAFTVYGFVVAFAVPIALISLSYARIIMKLRRTRSEVSPQLRAKQKERKKVTYLVLVIIGIYILTYTPYWVNQVIVLLIYLFHDGGGGVGGSGGSGSADGGHERTKAVMAALTQLLVYFNSALNPFIYAFMSVNFRSNFRETFKCDKAIYLIRSMFSRTSTQQPSSPSQPENNPLAQQQQQLQPPLLLSEDSFTNTPPPMSPVMLLSNIQHQQDRF